MVKLVEEVCTLHAIGIIILGIAELLQCALKSAQTRCCSYSLLYPYSGMPSSSLLGGCRRTGCWVKKHCPVGGSCLDCHGHLWESSYTNTPQDSNREALHVCVSCLLTFISLYFRTLWRRLKNWPQFFLSCHCRATKTQCTALSSQQMALPTRVQGMLQFLY